MINHVYQLISPGVISVKYTDISLSDKVIVRPEYMALCHADQRYFQGQRDAATLRRKLPMALIHECCGRVVYDPTGILAPGQRVTVIPNLPPRGHTGEIYENYAEGSRFLSSGCDGFMQELVALDADRVIPCGDIPPQVAAVMEFVSVAVHATTRFDKVAHSHRRRIGIWGDGSMAYVVANVLKARFPDSHIVVVGRHRQKLSQFSFVQEAWLTEDVPSDMWVDHAFECAGGVGCRDAIEDIIAHIRPQGALMLMGVSEYPVPVNTRMVLEKGITMVGSSRSGREDFLLAAKLMAEPAFQRRLKVIVFQDKPVRCIGDIHRVFQNDLTTPFKTVFRWEL